MQLNSTHHLRQIMDFHKSTHEVERIVAGAVSCDMYLEHMGRYLFAAPYVQGMTVLDAACGTGYGTYYLANRGAKWITGIDLSYKAATYANTTYRMNSLKYCSGDVTKMPFCSHSFNLITSFETVEHLRDPESFIAECKRLLMPNATFIISTPNREVHASQGICVPYHEKEYLLEEFELMVSKHFRIQGIYGQMPLSPSQLSQKQSTPSILLKIASFVPKRIRRIMLPFYESYITGNPLLPTIRYYLNGLGKNIIWNQPSVPFRYRILPLDKLGPLEKFKTCLIVAAS